MPRERSLASWRRAPPSTSTAWNSPLTRITTPPPRSMTPPARWPQAPRCIGGTTYLGGRCNKYATLTADQKKDYDWKYCKNMVVGETYEVHWPHSEMGACNTKWQYQYPF